MAVERGANNTQIPSSSGADCTLFFLAQLDVVFLASIAQTSWMRRISITSGAMNWRTEALCKAQNFSDQQLHQLRDGNFLLRKIGMMKWRKFGFSNTVHMFIINKLLNECDNFMLFTLALVWSQES